MAELGSFDALVGLSDDERAAILQAQFGDEKPYEETVEERNKRLEFQRAAELLNEEFIASLTGGGSGGGGGSDGAGGERKEQHGHQGHSERQRQHGHQEHIWSVDEDAGLARALQESRVRLTMDTDAEMARNLEYQQLLEEAAATKIRTSVEEEYTRAVMHNSSTDIPLWEGMLIYTCPHCNGKIATVQTEIACTIFTHGTTSAGQVGQHLSEAQASAIAVSGAVKAGCMKQYKLVAKGDKYDAVVCSGL